MYNMHCIKLTHTRATCPIIRICVFVIIYFIFLFAQLSTTYYPIVLAARVQHAVLNCTAIPIQRYYDYPSAKNVVTGVHRCYLCARIYSAAEVEDSCDGTVVGIYYTGRNSYIYSDTYIYKCRVGAKRILEKKIIVPLSR